MKYTLEQCIAQQKKVDAGINHEGEYLPWLAAVAEVIEMCEHLSLISTWKKQSEPDLKQAFMELVDVFAFVMSGRDSNDINPYDINESMISCRSEVNHTGEIFRILISSICNERFNFALGCILAICKGYFGRDYDDIYYYYMGKQILTRFRQDNGYKDGTYFKNWGDLEDNEYLTYFLENVNELDDLYNSLSESYAYFALENGGKND